MIYANFWQCMFADALDRQQIFIAIKCLTKGSISYADLPKWVAMKKRLKTIVLKQGSPNWLAGQMRPAVFFLPARRIILERD